MKYSVSQMIIENILIVILTYLLFSFALSLIHDIGYLEMLVSKYQILAIILVYWGPPSIRLIYMMRHNDKIKIK